MEKATMIGTIEDYLLENTSELADYARELHTKFSCFDWAEPLNGLDEVLDEVCDGSLEGLISLFIDNRSITVSDYETYYFDWDNDELFEAYGFDCLCERNAREVAYKLYDAVLVDGFEVSDELMEIIKPSPSFDDLIALCEKDVGEALACVNASLHNNEQLHYASMAYVDATKVLEYFKDTRFCGIPEELYGSLDCERLIDHIVGDYNNDGYQGRVTIQKFAEMYIKIILKLGVYE